MLSDRNPKSELLAPLLTSSEKQDQSDQQQGVEAQKLQGDEQPQEPSFIDEADESCDYLVGRFCCEPLDTLVQKASNCYSTLFSHNHVDQGRDDVVLDDSEQENGPKHQQMR